MQRLPVHKRWSSILQCTVDTCKSFRWWWLGPSLPASSPSGGARNVMEAARPSRFLDTDTTGTDAARPPAACKGDGDANSQEQQAVRCLQWKRNLAQWAAVTAGTSPFQASNALLDRPPIRPPAPAGSTLPSSCGVCCNEQHRKS